MVGDTDGLADGGVDVGFDVLRIVGDAVTCVKVGSGVGLVVVGSLVGLGEGLLEVGENVGL